jgi:MFS family permease
VTSYQGLLAQRFFLGVTEAGLSPAFSLITVMWYKRQEQPLRFAIWFSASGFSTLIGSLIFYAIGHIHGRLAAWQYQFMIIGSVSSVWGICVWFLLPDSPLTAFFLSKDMKIVAVERMRLEQIGIENKRFKLEQVKETFTDPKTYLYMLMIFSINITNGAAGGFGSIIVLNFGVCYSLYAL